MILVDGDIAVNFLRTAADYRINYSVLSTVRSEEEHILYSHNGGRNHHSREIDGFRNDRLSPQCNMRNKGFRIIRDMGYRQFITDLLRQPIQCRRFLNAGPDHLCFREKANAGKGNGERLLHRRKNRRDILRPFADKGQGQMQIGRIKISCGNTGRLKPGLQH